jgi:class 3 adenylate cyclase/tetratricopeptide (TPR) repeat protein
LAREGFDRGSGCLEVAGWCRVGRAPRAGSAARRVGCGGGGRRLVVLRVAGDRLGGRRVSGLPGGAVTFLFTDIEGSTRLVKALRERYAEVLAEHRQLVRAAIAGQGGYEVDTQGDAFFAAFAGAKQAVLCALEIQRALAAHEWPAGTPVRVRIGVHTGQAVPADGGYTGLAVHRAARICAVARGGQVLVSQATQMIIEDEEEEPGFALVDLGERTLKDLDRPVRLFELAAPGLEARGGPTAARPGGGAAAATRTLPRDLASFTGRQRELRELVDAAAGAAGPGGVVGIHAIGEMAGVGKTAFAVHAAHRLAARFPDGQIFLPLHGNTPGQQPVDPADALASLLLTAGVPAGQIPPGLEARMALWRDRLAEKQLLLILDDAADGEQVLPLLPGAGGSLVLVTSRRHLTALGDAAAIGLDILPPSEAAALLARLAGRAGLGPDDPAAGQITRLCGYLPLAIGMVARQLHHDPAWSPAARAAELAAARDRLELMTTENLSVAAAFTLSYEDLAEDQQRLFRRLGLHPGPDIDGYAAAALDGTGLAATRRKLEALYDQYLLTEPVQGRYRLHDLIREHARALAERDDLGSDRDQATARLLDYYQHAGALADALLARQARPAPASAADAVPTAVPGMVGQEQALAWARGERANLLGCLDHATGTGQYARIVALTAGLASLLRHDGPWAEAIARHSTAVCAAQQLGDRLGQANALTDLGEARRLARDHPGAARDLEEALGIYRDLGDRLGQANALSECGRLRLAGDHPGAARDLEEALGIYRDLGDRLGQAHALTFLGEARRLAGDHPDAARDLEEALGIYRDLGDRPSQTHALTFLGEARRLAGNWPGAARALEEALGICRDIGDRLGQAHALIALGRMRRMTGDYPGAAAVLEEALGIFRDLGDRGGEAEALNEAGTLHRACGDLGQAGSCHQQALDLARQIGSSWDQAHALAGLGRCVLATGHTAGAEGRLRQALEIFQRIGAAEAADVSAELQALTDARPAAQGS